MHHLKTRLQASRPPSRRHDVIRRDGRAAQITVVSLVVVWILCAAPLLSWLMPERPATVLFLTLAVPLLIMAFLIGHNRGWWD